MAGKTKRAALVLTEDQKKMLKELSRSRTAPAREIIVDPNNQTVN